VSTQKVPTSGLSLPTSAVTGPPSDSFYSRWKPALDEPFREIGKPQNWPTKAEVQQAMQYGLGRESSVGASATSPDLMLHEVPTMDIQKRSVTGNTVASLRAILPEPTIRAYDKASPLTKETLAEGFLAARRSSVATLGMDLGRLTVSADKGQLTVSGMYDPKDDRMWADMKSPSAVVHESIHRGFEQLRKYAKETGDTELAKLVPSGHEDELFTRAMMVKHFGAVEENEGRYRYLKLTGRPIVGNKDAEKRNSSVLAQWKQGEEIARTQADRLNALEDAAAALSYKIHGQKGPR
jgi:hypothetical protein